MLRDERLSYRARGLLACLLSRPDNWSTTSEALAREGQEGRDAVRTALRELEDAGYLVRERRQDERGRWSVQAVLFDTPQAAAPKAQVTPETDSQASVSQASVLQASVSQAISKNTDQEQITLPTVGDAAPAAPAAKAKAKARAKGPADEVAAAVYDAASGMVNFLGMRTIAARALRVEGTTAEQVTAAMTGLYAAGRPITLTTVGQALAGTAGGGITPTNADHWATGGGYA